MSNSLPDRPTAGAARPKKDHTPPRLTDYGNLRDIVQGQKGGSKTDGGGTPATKR